ncbi:AMP-dependent synthetase [Rhodomicrobium udaipurense JA643]|uniref:Acyl--CoA ligase n=1 Tax=Rhodomicrobium udaipurense TaxID=1202716 RepID=A0A8I1GI77_9HYPH|nr:class I adenylate-forming enzyme family protein [Rhodomicrobium udaipurense]KAI94786.1 AMP-dependent synthetase [Rhodomicrobium udaipurense JA643]MBJ7544881.1 acyl--CoA ligase [Rhodomicrobium udaipurense]
MSANGYRGELPPRTLNMAKYVLCAGAAARDKTALVVIHDPAGRAAETWTYRALESAVLRVAFELRAKRRLAPGSRVLIRLRNRTPYALAFFGAIAGGLVPVPASPDLTARELGFLLDDSDAAAIVLDDTLPHGDFAPGLAVVTEAALLAAIDSGPEGAFADTAADDPAFLIYTSGTTANPKGVLHAHRSVWGRRPMYGGWYGITAADRLLHSGVINWTYAMGTGLSDPLANGATALLYTGERHPSIWPGLIRAFDVTIFAGVPGLYHQIMRQASGDRLDLARLRHGLTAGDTLPDALEAEWCERTGTRLYEGFGQTELSTYLSNAPDFPRKPGTVGRAQPGRCVAILPEDRGDTPLPPGEAGMIAVHRSDPGLMLGYWQRPDEEREMFRGEWFTGGDLGRIDEDGAIAHLGRASDLMNAGGYRVSPVEVEAVLREHPLVAEAGVIDVPQPHGGTAITAFVVAREGGADFSAELAARAEASLAAYKRPRHYVFVERLPKTPNGKLKRSDLKNPRPL